jgi:hypothetical protein
MEADEVDKVRAVVFTTTGGLEFESPRGMLWGCAPPLAPSSPRTEVLPAPSTGFAILTAPSHT